MWYNDHDRMEYEKKKYDLFSQELNQADIGRPKLDQSSDFVEMDGLMNRSRGMAEGVVVMVCPVLLALALDKVDHKVYEHRDFLAMLAMAGLTLITGICPVIVCCLSRIFPALRNAKAALLVTASLAALSATFLIILTCFITLLIVRKVIIRIVVGVLSGCFVLVRMVFYYHGVGHSAEYTQPLHDILDESHEFLTGITGILFLGLEGLALESHDNQMFEKATGAVGIISLIVCALGVCLMYFEMVPPLQFNERRQIVGFTLVLDFLMAVGTFVLLVKVMHNLMGIPALVLFTPPVGIIGELVYRVANQDNPDGQQGPPPPSKLPASLELTRVTFTGFLAVSITAIKNTSPSMLTVCFLLFAAVAIVFGISWRLLTQSQISSRQHIGALPAQVALSANFASLCTHFCIVIATILFLAMAGRAIGK